MTASTPKKTSFENRHLRSCEYFAIIQSSLNSIMLMKYAKTGPQGSLFKQIQRIKELVLYAHFVVETANVAISCCRLAEDSTELF